MHLWMMIAFLVAMVVVFALGYSFRGWIHKEITLSEGAAKNFAARLELAAARGGDAVIAEAKSVAGDIRKALDAVALKL
jgi:hypothetical protein